MKSYFFNNSWLGTCHWSEAKHLIEEKLQRKLKEHEITILSLSLCFGPMPILNEKQQEIAVKKLWPEGNPLGFAISPEEVETVIFEILSEEYKDLLRFKYHCDRVNLFTLALDSDKPATINAVRKAALDVLDF